jgi:hypothetical protein
MTHPRSGATLPLSEVRKRQKVSQLHRVTPGKQGQALAWSVLLATALGLASLLQAVATSALTVPAQAAPPVNRVSAATAALADGDDVRARFLSSLPDGTIDATSAP